MATAWMTMLEASEQFRVLDTLVQEPNASVQEALQRILDLTESAIAGEATWVWNGETRPYDIHLVCFHFARALIEIAERTPPSQLGKVVDLVYQLQKHTVKDPATGEPLKPDSDQRIAWTELPSLGYVVTDALQFKTWDPNQPPEEKRRYENKHGLLAQLANVADVEYNGPEYWHAMDHSLIAIHAFQDALESKASPQELLKTVKVRSACMWFIYGVDRLWANVAHERIYPARCGAQGGSLYPGNPAERPWKGFHRNRWAVWEESLRGLHAVCTDDQGTRKLIEDALSNLKRVENW